MIRISLRSVAGLVFAAGLLLPAIASAQVALHELSVKGKLLFQDENKKEEPKRGSQSFNERDLIGICLGEEKPDKKLKLFLRLDCQAPGNNAIEIWDTGEPVGRVAEIGSLSLETEPIVTGKSFQEPKSITTLASAEVECEGISLDFGGKIEIKFSEDDQGNYCPRTAKGSKLVGTAENGEDAIMDNVSVSAKKPTVNVQVPQ